MGLFSSKKTYVSSTVYNMAGDINKRPDFLKTLVTSHMIKNSGSKSISSSIQKGYLEGPGTRLRKFGTWSQNHFPAVGQIRGNLYAQAEIPPELIIPEIPRDPNQTVNIQNTEVLPAEYSYWAEQWMLNNYPAEIDSAWTSDYNEQLNQITLTRTNGVSVSFTPTDFVKSSVYLYALYNLIRASETSPLIQGVSFLLQAGENYPSTSGWTSTSNTSSTDVRTLNKSTKKTITYSDNRPPEVSITPSSSTDSYTYYRGVFERTDYKGSLGDTSGTDQLYSTRRVMLQNRDGRIVTETSQTESYEELNDGKLIRTTKIEITEEKLVVDQSYRIDTQDISRATYSPAKLLIYRIGSGKAAIDAKASQAQNTGYYLPFIPVRLDNKMVSTTYLPDVYDQDEQAYKKLTGSAHYDTEVVKSIAENKSLKDMDYVYIMLGVSLNTKENTAKEYLYRFFDRVRLTQLLGTTAYTNWNGNEQGSQNAFTDWVLWRAAQNDPANPRFGSTAPTLPGSSTMPTNQIRIKGSGTLNTNLDIQITWQSIIEITGTGQRKPGAKAGDYFVEFVGRSQFNTQIYNLGRNIEGTPSNVDRIDIHYQVTNNSWKTLQITGLIHKNFIYKGKYVEISAKEAMADTEESGFLIPLHYEIIRNMPMTHVTQLSTACCYMVINSYLVKKTGFFGSTFFKILAVVAVVAITYATGGAGAFSSGLLGSSAAVGAALGLSGALAFIVGAVANTLVAMIVTQLISAGAVAIFGDRFGAIIGAIAAVVTIQVGTSLANGSSVATSFAGLTKADNIIAMTSAVGGGISGYMKAGALETVNKTEALQKKYEEQSSDLSNKYAETFGIGKAQLDPFDLFSNSEVQMIEGLDTFLERTLMTGSDIAELSHTLLSNFSDITLATNLDL